MKYVIDTNVLIACVSRKSEHYWIWQALINEEFTLCVTTDILAEYEEILGDFYSPAFAKYIMEVIDEMANIQFINKYYFWRLITIDPDDNKFVDCAIACNAKCIVSEDKHFNILKDIEYPKVVALKIADFKILMKK
jgi:uncharacterized protein